MTRELTGLVAGLRNQGMSTSNAAADAIERLSWALWSIMGGMQDHDIQAETGLPDGECDRIAQIRSEADAVCAEYGRHPR